MRLLIICLLYIGGIPLFAKVVNTDHRLNKIYLAPKIPVVFRFDHPVRTISHVSLFDIKPANSEDPDYSVLSITPRGGKGEQNAVFLLSDGTAVKTKLMIKKSSKSDVIYEFRSKTKNYDSSFAAQEVPEVSAIDLLKSMIRNETLIGYHSRYVQERTARLGYLQISLLKVHTGPKFKGFTYKVKNLSKRSVRLSPKVISIGSPNNAIVTQISRKNLRPYGKRRSSTIVRIVADQSAAKDRLYLPIR